MDPPLTPRATHGPTSHTQGHTWTHPSHPGPHIDPPLTPRCTHGPTPHTLVIGPHMDPPLTPRATHGPTPYTQGHTWTHPSHPGPHMDPPLPPRDTHGPTPHTQGHTWTHLSCARLSCLVHYSTTTDRCPGNTESKAELGPMQMCSPTAAVTSFSGQEEWSVKVSCSHLECPVLWRSWPVCMLVYPSQWTPRRKPCTDCPHRGHPPHTCSSCQGESISWKISSGVVHWGGGAFSSRSEWLILTNCKQTKHTIHPNPSSLLW